MNAIEFKSVSKKFRKGEQFDSLRDFIPSLAKIFFAGDSAKLQKKEFWAVNNVSFELKKGDALGIIGSNGAGKSTILKLLSKIITPTKGKIDINGKLSSLLEVGAGFHPDLTGRENIYLSGAIAGMKKIEISKNIDSIIQFSGLNDFIDTPVKRYSSGMYVRLGFSVAAHLDPDILLIDEVLSVGDFSFQGKCIKKIQDFRKNGKTIIFISHDMGSVTMLCNRVILLKNGQIIKDGNPGTAITEYYNSVSGHWSPSMVENKKAIIKDIKFENTDVLNKSIQPGEHLKCRITVECIDSCKLSPGFFITQGNNFVFSTTYQRMKDSALSLASGDVVELSWDVDLNLNGGNYNIGFHLEDVETGLYHEHAFNCGNIHIYADHSSDQIVFLNPIVNLKKITHSLVGA